MIVLWKLVTDLKIVGALTYFSIFGCCFSHSIFSSQLFTYYYYVVFLKEIVREEFFNAKNYDDCCFILYLFEVELKRSVK